MRKNKIVATLWPAISQKWILKKIDNFIDVYRINLSHADLFKTRELIKDIRDINDKKVFMLDTKWPEIRTTNEKELSFQKWDIIKVYSTPKENYVSFEYEFFENIPENVEISFNDKAVDWIVKKNNKDFLEVEITQWWSIWYNKTINFIWYEIELDFLTDKDKKDIWFWIEENIALLAVSFVKTHKDIIRLREFLNNEFKSDMKIISKIETVSAVEDIEKIIKVSDWIMIARWDLWANIDPVKLPEIQRRISKLCNLAWKPVILATQVMSSMVNKPIPTRAEIDEIAFNIINWVDAFMLSDESAIWKYPIETLECMDKIIKWYQDDVKNMKFEWKELEKYIDEENKITDYIIYSAKKIATKLNVKFIVTPTSTWYTPWKIAALKPSLPILTFTNSDRVFKYCNLMFWVKSNKVSDDKFDYKKLKQVVGEYIQLKYKWKIVGEDKILFVHSSITQNKANMINWIEVIKFKDL